MPDETKPATRPQREETPQRCDPAAATAADRSASGRWRLRTLLVFAVALVALVPTTGDIGMTWDEPAYRYSQVMSAQWWDQLAHARSWGEVRSLLDPETLLYYWPYARYGINFHPPLAGQLNLATHALFGSWMKDIPARRMASVIEFALTIAIGFGFLARRYGTAVGLVMAGSLLLMPRLYGQAHLIDTDIPGLFLWAATALAFWNGLHEEKGRRWRVLVGVLLGLSFVEKMAAVGVVLPLLLWLAAGHLTRTLARPGSRADWIDGLVTSGLMLLPLILAFQEIEGLQRQLPPPAQTNLFVHRPSSDLPGVILAAPLAIWFLRRLLGRIFPGSKLWGVERPAIETWTAILAFAPVVGWLGNPAWWRETLPRLAHYYTLSNDRQRALPNIQIIYFGQTYEYTLPWHNAWVLLGITVPVTILIAAAIGIVWALGQIRRDRLPLYFLVHFLTFPVLRMLPTPAHDGIRLFLPTFFFLAALAGWGTVALARDICRRTRMPAPIAVSVLAALVLGPAALDLARIHPFELSYYNALIGGPRGAWHRGFELTYWFDAFNGQTLEELNQKLPPGAELDFPNDLTNPMTFQELQILGALRGDLKLGGEIKSHGRRYEELAYVWLQTQDSKATAFSRLLFAMRPWYAREPAQVDGLRLATVADPVAVARAWGLEVLLDAADRSRSDPPSAPGWVRAYAPILSRLWGDGLKKVHRLTLNQGVLEWARGDPHGLLEAARYLAAHGGPGNDPAAGRLVKLIAYDPVPKTLEIRQFFLDRLLKARPEGLVEGVQILLDHPAEVVAVMTRHGYTDPRLIGGCLDRNLPDQPKAIAPWKRQP
ncbi:MAG: glycosyltransferase family 39 protein [Isosphaeraceae bacterium]